MVRFNGYDYQDNYTGKVDFFLADYRFEKNGEVILIKNFTTVDLSPLGFVNKIVIEMFSSLNDYEGNMLMEPFVLTVVEVVLCMEKTSVLIAAKIS
jgi:hypothetical protein